MTEKIQVRSWQRSATIGLLKAQAQLYQELKFLEGLVNSILNTTSVPDVFSDLIYGEGTDLEKVVDEFLEVV